MSKRNFAVVAVVAVAMLVAGGLYASNMGFKLNYPLASNTTSRSGTNSLALPYNQQTNLINASDLAADINATAAPGTVLQIGRFNKQIDLLQVYDTVTLASDYALVPGEGYRVQVNQPVDYIVVGSHDPGLVIGLDTTGTNGSKSGTNDFAFPYHGTAAFASDLAAEINAQSGVGAAVLQIGRFNNQIDLLQVYDTVTIASDFALSPGESYRIQVNTNVAYVPNHY